MDGGPPCRYGLVTEGIYMDGCCTKGRGEDSTEVSPTLIMRSGPFTRVQAPEMELDVLGAESEGQIGYLLERELSGKLPGSQVVALLTQTVVDPKDPAFSNPTKFIGPMYSEQDAERYAAIPPSLPPSPVQSRDASLWSRDFSRTPVWVRESFAGLLEAFARFS